MLPTGTLYPCIFTWYRHMMPTKGWLPTFQSPIEKGREAVFAAAKRYEDLTHICWIPRREHVKLINSGRRVVRNIRQVLHSGKCENQRWNWNHRPQPEKERNQRFGGNFRWEFSGLSSSVGLVSKSVGMLTFMFDEHDEYIISLRGPTSKLYLDTFGI